MPPAPVTAPRVGWDYETPAESAEDRLDRLDETIGVLQKVRRYENVKCVCMNVRFAWGGIYVDGDNVAKLDRGLWDRWGAADNTLLDRFILSADRAVILVSDTYTPNPDEAKLIARYTRSCSARLSWARLLRKAQDRTVVLLAMIQYAKNIIDSQDPVD